MRSGRSQRFDQARPFVVLAVALAVWLVVPVAVRSFVRMSFFEMTAPVAAVSSYVADVQHFWELRLHTRAGHLPWVLWTRPTTVGVRSWVLCPPGTCSDDFRDSAKEIAAACGGREARVTASRRWSLLVVIDVLRRDLLAPGTTVRSRLASNTALAPVLVPAQVLTGLDDEEAEPVPPAWPHVGPGGTWS